jgi:polar amino acid transport system substrate-binding protein
MPWMLGTLLILSSMVEAQTTLRIAYPKFPPFHYINEKGDLTGFFFEIITEALQHRMGVQLVWTEYPWPRCQESVKNNLQDAVLTVPTAERAVYATTHANPFYQKSLNLFTYAGHPRMLEIRAIQALADLQKGGFAVITYSSNGWHKENIQPLGIKTYETPTLENVWKMLAGQRGDVVIEWPPGAWPDIDSAGVSDKIVDTSLTISSMPFHLLIRKTYPHTHILPEFDKTIQRMKDEGAITAILSKYSL